MSEDIHYEVLEIMRQPNILESKVKSTFLFKLVLFNKKVLVKTVSPLLYDDLVKGGLFRGDFIKIKEENDYIEYETVESGTPCCVPFAPKEAYLPFLNDNVIMPDFEVPHLEIESLNHPSVSKKKYQSPIGEVIIVDYYISKKTNQPITGRVLYKSRVKTYSFFKKKPYFFQVVLQGSRNLKVKFWGKCASYHSGIDVGDCIVISEYRRKKNERNESYLVYNSFHEDLYFNFPEINVNSGTVYKVELSTGVELHPLDKPINKIVEGKITYMSVLMRHRSKWTLYTSAYGSVYEYFLVKVGDEMVILYSNSTRTFYDLEVGMEIRLENLRMYVRGEVYMYLSTIYTHITILNKSTEDRDANLIQGALGFIPERGLDLEALVEEKTEVFQVEKQEREVVVVPLWKPEVILLKELDEAAETLVLNETRKYVFRAKLLGYSFASFSKNDNAVKNWTSAECFSISYTKNGEACEQRCAVINVGNEDTKKALLLFKNYFFADEVLVERVGASESLDDLSLQIGTWFNFVVDVFRASKDNVLLCLSQAF